MDKSPVERSWDVSMDLVFRLTRTESRLISEQNEMD